jgi:hypothetical protein
MRRTTVVALVVVALLGGGSAAHAAAPPAEFGTDWDDPRTAAPPVAVPPTHSCTVRIVDHQFVNFDTYTNPYTPPAGCAGPWAKVVLHLSGAVAGRQFDRLGWLDIGGVTVFKTSTPEPSPEGIRWSVEKDVTGYASLLRAPSEVHMFLGNIVNDTFTGVLDIQVDLAFYAADRAHPAPASASDVLPLPALRDPGTTGTVTVPRNAERLLAEVYATGSGGGCEEFWYLTAPPASGYSCPADQGPYREVQILLDGTVAGIAVPFPHVYTGGWSNPFLWYVLPAPRAFDVAPLTLDLTPYLGRLTDGAPHTVAIHVVGVPAGQPGWDTPVNLLAWRDPHAAQVTGQVIVDKLDMLRNDSTFAMVDGMNQVTTSAAHHLTAVGVLRTSHGIVTSVVDERLTNDSTHRFGAEPGENPDNLTAAWTDTATVAVAGVSRFAGLSRVAQRYAIDGGITVSADNRLTTTITMTDAAATLTGRLDDTYTGTASYTLGVPRDQRHATGTSSEHYRLSGDNCYDHTIATENGFVTTDVRRC